MNRFLFVSSLAVIWAISVSDPASAQSSTPATTNDWLSQYPIFSSDVRPLPNTVTSNYWSQNSAFPANSNGWSPNMLIPTKDATSAKMNNDWLANYYANRSSQVSLNGPRSLNGPGTSNGPGSQEWINRAKEFSRVNQQLFPGALYDYRGWMLPGSVNNNPYSLYGPAASIPTVFNPNFVAGKYGVKVVPYRSPNIYARPQYDYVPVPLPQR
jgi:hypothetical protein